MLTLLPTIQLAALSGHPWLQVWRSVRDWDPHSRGMLAGYLHAAKGVVQTKQARPGVAVHVRLGGDTDAGGNQEDGDDMGIAGSYAVWAVTTGRDACGVVRVACSKMAQTEVPRSAVQRVQVSGMIATFPSSLTTLPSVVHDPRVFLTTGWVRHARYTLPHDAPVRYPR